MIKNDLINIPKRIKIIGFCWISISSILKIDENICLSILNVFIAGGLFIGILKVKSIYYKYCNDYIIEREWIGDIIDGRACNGYGMKIRGKK